MSKEYRLVALDLDGTTLDREGQVPPLTEELLARVRCLGTAVVVATGRMSPSARPWARRLGGEGGLAITYNGAQVISQEKIIIHRPLALQIAHKVLGWAKDRGIYIQAYCNDRLLVERLEEKALNYARDYGVEAIPVGSLLEAVAVDPTKLLCIGEPVQTMVWRQELANFMGDEAEIFLSGPPFLDVLAMGVSKGEALGRLAKEMGLSMDECLAFGDGENDREMLQMAGTGVAMDHAPPATREVAAKVVPYAGGLGVAGVLEDLLGRNKFQSVSGVGGASGTLG